ncbi:MAG: BON domain-containing protein [Anaerolineales bacterium]
MAVATAMRRRREEDLLGAIKDALWRYEPVRSRSLPIEVTLESDDAVGVHGNTPTRIIKESILGLVGSIAGDQRVLDDLHADPAIELKVAEALATDPSTQHLAPGTIQVFADLGNVVLVGSLEKADRAAAVRVAGAVPGVRRVVDRLES